MNNIIYGIYLGRKPGIDIDIPLLFTLISVGGSGMGRVIDVPGFGNRKREVQI